MSDWLRPWHLRIVGDLMLFDYNDFIPLLYDAQVILNNIMCRTRRSCVVDPVDAGGRIHADRISRLYHQTVEGGKV